MFILRLSNRSTRALVLLAWTIAIAISAWVTAVMLNRVLAPERSISSLDRIVDPRIAAQRIGGRSLVSGRDGPPVERVAAPRQRFALIGVATGFGLAPGFALLRAADGQVSSVQVGEDVAPGVTLVRIDADHVEIEQGGAREIVRLDARSPALPLAPTAMTPNPTNRR